MTSGLFDWLDEGDVSIRFQTQRDLLGYEDRALQDRIHVEGWGKRFLDAQNEDGHWGRDFYQPKWISTHYSLLDLKMLCPRRDLEAPHRAIERILKENTSDDGGVNPAKTIKQSDVCVSGMFLQYACYFQADEEALKPIVEFVIDQQMPDGGFNCRRNRSGAVHSSMHSTISLLEGIHEYEIRGYRYRMDVLVKVARAGEEFLLSHRLFRSDRTGEVIDKRWLRLSFPSRWFYDILRALVYFETRAHAYDERMEDALLVLKGKRRKDGTWPLQAKHTGQTHFDMEQTGNPSRWNTLRALRVLRRYAPGEIQLGM